MEENKFYYIQDDDDYEFQKLIDFFNKNFDFKSERVDFDYLGKVYYIINQSKLHNYGMQEMDFISNEIKQKIKFDENFKVIIHSSHESIDDLNFKQLKKYITNNELNETKFILYNNSANIKEIQLNNNTNFNYKKSNFLSHFKINDMRNSTGSFFKKQKENGKFFMSFNKEDKKHRYALLIFLKKYGLLDDTNWSFLPTYKKNLNYDYLRPILDNDKINYLKDEIDYFINLKYKFSDYENGLEYNLQNVITQTMVEDIRNYENSYVNLTTESVFDERENVVHITEKSYKPFFYYQFPLLLSSENHIKKMKELYNLDFFEDIIDYGYDAIVDDKERFLTYCNEINRIYENKSFFIDFYENNQERFESNKNKIIQITNLLNEDYQFFSNLI
jgi:hypothetical protein